MMPRVSSSTDVAEQTRSARVALAASLVAALGLLVGTLLYLLDELDVIADAPVYLEGGSDREAQLAANTVTFFERQHDVWWNIAVRDSVLPLAFLSLMVLVCVFASRVRWRPEAILMVVFFVVGGTLVIVNDLMYLGQLQYWRHTGWSADPSGPIIALGAASDAVVSSTIYLEAAGFLVLAPGAVCLGWLCRNTPESPRGLGALAYAEAAGLLLLGLSIIIELDTLFQLSGALTGILLGPVVALALGRHLGNLQSPRPLTAEEPELAHGGPRPG